MIKKIEVFRADILLLLKEYIVRNLVIVHSFQYLCEILKTVEQTELCFILL
jgi:hypothetical protein